MTGGTAKYLKENPPSWASTLVLAVAMLAGGGGAGSAFTGRSVSAELAVVRQELSGKLDRLNDKLTDQNRHLSDIEQRLREVERRQQQLDDLIRRVSKLEERGQ